MWDQFVFVTVPVWRDNAIYIGNRRKQSETMPGRRGAAEGNR